MGAKPIPITPVKAELSDAKRMAVAAIENFLGRYYGFSQELLAESNVAKIIAGYWYSRVPGFHDEDDFLHLTRDMLLYLQSGGERSQVSDQLAYFFSGFMPTYGATRTLLKMVGDGQPWSEVQAFMHAQSYGNARQYVETFNWQAGEKKAHTEVKAWADVIQTQVDKLEASRTPLPVQLAYVAPGLPLGLLAPQVPVVTPVAPPTLPPLAPLAPAAQGVGIRILTFVATRGPVLLMLLLWSPELNSGEDAWLRKRDEEAKKKRLLIREIKEQVTVAVNTTNNECKPQRTQNQENGAECENDGYVIMESALKYKRLVDPPKGRGLDGLFEKLAPEDGPWPFPETVTIPKPGKLVFIPEEAQPPKARYDFTGQPPRAVYPKFVVFEAKNVSMGFDEKDADGIQNESKKRLKNTCDGQQMGVPWTEKRIPQALKRQNPGAKNNASRKTKEKEITNSGYARWIFVCLPGPIGANTKLYVLIDVVASGMDLESKAAVPRKSSKPTPDTGY